MDNIKLYNVDSAYIDYLSAYAPHLFFNKQKDQRNERKYIGIVLTVNGINYFAPLSSYKDKHKLMKERIDFIKIKRYAVINLNNMFPVADGTFEYVDISKERNPRYRDLLRTEYRYIKSIQEKIRKNAANLYHLKLTVGNTNALTKRCNDFLALEKACKGYQRRQNLIKRV